MTEPSATTSAVWRSGLIPTIAALFVTSVQIIERAQVEWAAECGVPGICATVQQGEFFGSMLGWLPAVLVFAVLHAALRRYPAEIDAARPDRLARVLAFIGANIYPHVGWYMALAGMGAGILAAVTVIGLPVAPFVGVVGATWFGGVVLGAAAGPSFAAGWPVWRRVLLRYGNAAAMAGVVMAGGYGLFDPQFSLIAGVYPWLDAFGLLALTAAACCILWGWTLDAHEPVRPALPRLIMARAVAGLVMLGAILTAPTVLAVRAGVKPLALVEGSASSATAFIRGYKPPNAPRLTLHGLDFVGTRGQITQRTRERLDQMSDTRIDSWRMQPPVAGQDEIYIRADNGGASRELLCMAPSDGRRLCFLEEYAARDRPTEPMRHAMTYQSEDAFEVVLDLPDAYFGIRFDRALMRNGVALADGPRRYCRLGLVNVTPARLSVHQIVPCGQPWKEQAIRLRAHVEGLFKPRDGS